MRALNPAPSERRRGIALIRVSKERDGMISPENQRYAIEQYAERENIRITEWVEGIDQSGSRKQSAWWPKLDQAVAKIESKEAEVLLVWRIDRTARSRVKWAVAADRVETAGGYIESATEPNDRSPAGRFGRGVMAEHAAFMAESIGATWKETLERRVRHGLSPNGAPHYGYTYDRETGHYTIDPIEGEHLADMYRSYIAGDSGWKIAARMTALGTKRARWNTASVLRLLDTGFGAGYILFRGTLHPGKQDPVITPDEWTRFQDAREQRRRRPRAERSPYAYSGLIYCHCGGRMSGRTERGIPRYTCVESVTYVSHPSASLNASIIDAAIEEWLQDMRERMDEAARKLPRKLTPVNDPTRGLARRLAQVTERLDTATLKHIDGLIPSDSYERLRAQFEAERDQINKELSRASARATVRPIALVGDLLGKWADIPVERRREALRLLVDRIEVMPLGDQPRIVIKSALSLT